MFSLTCESKAAQRDTYTQLERHTGRHLQHGVSLDVLLALFVYWSIPGPTTPFFTCYTCIYE